MSENASGTLRIKNRSGRAGVMPPPDQLPAIIEPAALPAPADTCIVPALIAGIGDEGRYYTGVGRGREGSRLDDGGELVGGWHDPCSTGTIFNSEGPRGV